MLNISRAAQDCDKSTQQACRIWETKLAELAQGQPQEPRRRPSVLDEGRASSSLRWVMAEDDPSLANGAGAGARSPPKERTPGALCRAPRCASRWDLLQEIAELSVRPDHRTGVMRRGIGRECERTLALSSHLAGMISSRQRTPARSSLQRVRSPRRWAPPAACGEP